MLDVSKITDFVGELVSKGVDSLEIAREAWKSFSGKFECKNYPSRLVGYSPVQCPACGEEYNFYGNHECNAPIFDIIELSDAISRVLPDVTNAAKVIIRELEQKEE